MKNFIFILLIIVTLCGFKNICKVDLLTVYKFKYDNSSGNIIIIDNSDNKSCDWEKTPSCFFEHYYFAEYYKPDLYIIQCLDKKKPDWKNALWIYSSDSGIGKLLLKSSDVDYKINEEETLLSSYNLDTLIIFNLQNKEVRKIQISKDTRKDKYEYEIESMCWTQGRNTLYATLCYIDGIKYNFFSYDYDTNNLEIYQASDSCAYDFDINPNLGMLLYSDYPFIVDAESAEDLVKNKTTIHLYLLDFKSNKRIILKTSIGKGFGPRWVTNDIIEYNSPTHDKREQLILKKTAPNTAYKP